jgi:hypothetical protein
LFCFFSSFYVCQEKRNYVNTFKQERRVVLMKKKEDIFEDCSWEEKKMKIWYF